MLGVDVGVPLGVSLWVSEELCDSVRVPVWVRLGVTETVWLGLRVGVGVPLALGLLVSVGELLVLTVTLCVRLCDCVWLTLGDSVGVSVLLRVPVPVLEGDCDVLGEPVALDVCDCDGDDDCVVVGAQLSFTAVIQIAAYGTGDQIAPPVLAHAPNGMPNPDTGVWASVRSSGESQVKAGSLGAFSANTRAC